MMTWSVRCMILMAGGHSSLNYVHGDHIILLSLRVRFRCRHKTMNHRWFGTDKSEWGPFSERVPDSASYHSQIHTFSLLMDDQNQGGPRAPKACRACSKAKVRCELEDNRACKRCRRLNRECSGQEPGAHRRPRPQASSYVIGIPSTAEI